MYNSPRAAFRSPHHSPTSPSRRSPRDTYINGSHQSTYYPAHHRDEPRSPPATGLNGDSSYPPRDRPPKTFYDPTAEAREHKHSWQSPVQANRSPVVSKNPYAYPPPLSDRRSHDRDYSSSITLTRSHHSPILPPAPQSFKSPSDLHPASPPQRHAMPPPPSATSTVNERSPQTSPKRASNPMSFSNILSEETKPPPAPSPPSTRKSSHPPLMNNHHSPEASRASIAPAPSPSSKSRHTSLQHSPPEPQPRPRSTSQRTHSRKVSTADKQKFQASHPPQPTAPSKPKIIVNEKEFQAALAKIESMELSEPEDVGFEEVREKYKQRLLKRTRSVEELEAQKRKRRRMAQVQKLAMTFGNRVVIAKEDFWHANEKAVADQVHQESVREEKDKKKVQQRNRRRELQKQKHQRDAAELQQRAQETENQTEKEKLMREAQKAEKKVVNTTRLLNGEIPNRDLREATPLGPNLDGGIMGSFQMLDEQSQEPPKKRQRTGGRLKKSKEQKQAEKDAAAAAHAAMERGDDLVTIAPRGEPTPIAIKRDSSVVRDASPVGKAAASYVKSYDALYQQIWKDIARNAVPKVHRIKENSTLTKQSNLRKTAQLASKEARRWQQKTNKSQKDTQARGKRGMRDMLSFWKRNEREERDQRKLAEKQELESARKAEADREANRQKRKLNFLISQTELYSHFIGKKVKTDEVEKSTDDVAVANQKIEAGDTNAHTIDLPDNVSKPGPKVTNFEDLDFDNEDETALREAAMANAQNAVQEAQDRARAFNGDGQLQSEFDDGEMNFQNPTSLQSMDVPQPDMVTCQLKEYQLKGLNWLVNLYEQGINGILADEMGLGKTVQSISVMAYLAEVHNIWGPFLVIAPASTLHNWQQEITRFVPALKVLPYWGGAKDRKVLRKFWDRKHITYNKDSPFHVLVTSYQLVVQDTQYFQKIRWQYMILDEAQAIKSSQSSRWKSLLGFHCRNRLLLTGTPIQNNMQELWALLHFIMPSLFDSHDEFSDWFSKDIESHAQSNTKLNEDQLKRLHMILKPFMLRRIKKHVQKELGDKIEEDVFCDLTYRQRAYYNNLRNKISIMELIEKAAIGDDQDTATLMNLVMQFRKVCNHPDLFERAEVMSPVSMSYFAETASFMREGHNVDVLYSVRNLIEFKVPRLIGRENGRLDIAGPDNAAAGWRRKFLFHDANIWSTDRLTASSKSNGSFSWLKFVSDSPSGISAVAHGDFFQRAVQLRGHSDLLPAEDIFEDDREKQTPWHSMLRIVDNERHSSLSSMFKDGYMHHLMNVAGKSYTDRGLDCIEPSGRPAASAPPIDIFYSSQACGREKQQTYFSVPIRRALFGLSEKTENMMLDTKLEPAFYPISNMLPAPNKNKSRWTNIQCPSMRRFVTDSGKLAKLDQLLCKLKEGGHRVLLYFQMTRMIDLMEEYLTYRNYRYCRLDGSTKLEDRRDTVADFQNQSDIFVFLLSTRAGGLGINLTAADTVIFYDSDWNPTIDSQAMDRAHRLGQTRQVTVYRMITRGTIEERIRRRALQKEEVQRVVIQGGAGATVDFNARSRENRTKDIAMWLADDDQAAEIEKKEAELKEKEEREGQTKGKRKAAPKKAKEISLDDMYHEGEGHFDDSNKPSGAATPVEPPKKRKGTSKKAKTAKEKLAIIDGTA